MDRPCPGRAALLQFSRMRYTVLADIHGNLEALQAVLEHAQAQGKIDEVWCLGDTVGYGPDPGACLETLRRYPHTAVAGNHDWAATGKVRTEDFNPDAAAAVQWTGQHLSPEDIHYLEDLPLQVVRGEFTLVHGSPRHPIWEYLFSAAEAGDSFPLFTTPYCLVGHSHVPILFRQGQEEGPLPLSLSLGEERLIINPGGVGQPRDGDPRASYAIYDGDSRTLHRFRVPYDLELTQSEMMEQGLPLKLSVRLGLGL
ncbi:MAG: metallophosphoesterase family protein [Dehalococcoidia bacterium]